MNYLIIDTSTNTAVIALANDQEIIATHEWMFGRTLSESLLLEIDKLFKLISLEPSSLDGVIVYLGPGSYTGLRIGVSVANAFAYSLGIKAVGLQGEFNGEKFDTATMPTQPIEEMRVEGLVQMKKAVMGESLIPFYGREPNIG